MTDELTPDKIEPDSGAMPLRLLARVQETVAARPSAVAAGLWVTMWLALTVTGQGYSLRTLYAGYQLAPADAAYADPVGTVWNLHIQPPLWNLWTASIGAWSPLGLLTTHRLASLMFGVVLAWSVCETLRLLGASAGAAIGLTAVATMNTQVLQHAFEPRYDFALASLLALLVWSVARLRGGDEVRWPVAVPIAVATSIVLVRTLYHPVWLMVVAALVLWLSRGRPVRREAIVACLLAGTVIGGWMAKNAVQVDRFTMSSWTGMNLLRSTSPAADAAHLAGLSAADEISTIWNDGVPAFAYAQYCDEVSGGDPVIDLPTRIVPAEHQTGRFDDAIAPNFNARCFLPAYDQAAADFRYLLRNEPGAWVRGRVWASNNWFEVPATRVHQPSPLWRPVDVASRVALAGVPHPGLPAGWSHAPWWVHDHPQSLVLAAASLALVASAARRVRRGATGSDLAIVLCGLLVIYTMAVGILFELGEQSRFRNAIDPIVMAVGCWVIIEWVLRRRRSTTEPDNP